MGFTVDFAIKKGLSAFILGLLAFSVGYGKMSACPWGLDQHSVILDDHEPVRYAPEFSALVDSLHLAGILDLRLVIDEDLDLLHVNDKQNLWSIAEDLLQACHVGTEGRQNGLVILWQSEAPLEHYSKGGGIGFAMGADLQTRLSYTWLQDLWHRDVGPYGGYGLLKWLRVLLLKMNSLEAPTVPNAAYLLQPERHQATLMQIPKINASVESNTSTSFQWTFWHKALLILLLQIWVIFLGVAWKRYSMGMAYYQKDYARVIKESKNKPAVIFLVSVILGWMITPICFSYFAYQHQMDSMLGPLGIIAFMFCWIFMILVDSKVTNYWLKRAKRLSFTESSAP